MSRPTTAPRPARTRLSAAAPAAPVAALGEPRFAGLWAAGLYALLVLALAWPMFGGQFLVNPFSDEYIAGYAFREYGASTLRETGAFPQWNPYLFGGMPFIAAMHGDIFYPVAIALRWIFPTDTAMTLAFVVHTFLCGWFTYLFLRSLGLGYWPALLGGVAYLISGPIASYPSPGHDGKLYVSAMLPLALLLIVRLVRDGRMWAMGALALTVGFATLSPHPQMLQYMLLVAGSFALLLAFGGGEEGPLPRAVAIRRIAIALGAVVLGMLMGAVQYLPVAEYAPWSPRAGGKGWEHAISYGLPPEEMISMYLPQFSGILENYWGRNGIHFHSEYLVAVSLVLVGFAFGSEAPGRRRLTWFWLGALIVSILWSLAGATPFYKLVYHLIPGTKFFRAASMMLYVTAFSVAVLAAFGVDRALRGAYKPKLLVAWGIAAVLALLLAVSGGWTNLAASIVGEGAYDYIAQNQGNVVLGALRSLFFVAAAIGVLIALGRGRMPVRNAAIALVALVAIDGWTIARHYWRFMGPAEEIYGSDPTIDYLKKLPQPARVLAVDLNRQDGVSHDPMLSGDGLMSHRVRTALGYHGNELGRYQKLYGKESGGANIAHPKFWQLMNVQYLMADVAEPPMPGAERVAGPARNAAGSMVSLFRLPGEHPPAWVSSTIVKAPDDVVLGTIFDPRYDDVRRVALFDTSAAVTGVPSLGTVPPVSPIAVNVSKWEPGRISITLSEPAPAGSALVVSENYYPGWTATVDGKPATIGRANYVLTGVELPAGARNVELTFENTPYATGKLVTWLAAGGALLLLGAGLLLDRRRRPVLVEAPVA